MKRWISVLLALSMVLTMMPALAATVSAADMPIPENDNFTILWTTDPQWYSFAYPEIIDHQNKWVVDNYSKLDMRYIVHTGDFVNFPNDHTQWGVMDKAYKYWDNAGLAYGVLAGNHDVDGSDHSTYSQYFGQARFQSKPWYGGSYEDNFGHYDLMTIDGIDVIFVYMGYNSSYKQADYDWMNNVLAAHPNRIAMLAFHDYMAASGNRSPSGELFFQNVVLKNPNVRMVMCGHNYNSNRKIDEVDDNGDGKADRTVYQMMANYQSTTNGGNGFMRFMECDPQKGIITMRTYSPYLGQFGSDYETGAVIDGYGYRDEFVIPFDFSAPTVRADGTNGDVVVTPVVSFGVTNAAPAVTLKLGYQNAAESGTVYQKAGVYNRFFSLNAADAFSSPRSLNYVTATYAEGSGYTITKVTKGSAFSTTSPYVPVPQDGVVIALTSDAVDVNTLTVGRKVFLDRAPGIKAPSPIKAVTLRADNGHIFNIDEINRSIGGDQWVLYDDTTKNIYSHEWNMLFAFAPVNGSRERFKVTQMNLESGKAKMLIVPENGFVLAINSYSAGELFRDSLLECLYVGAELTLVGHAVGRPSAYNCQSFLPSSVAGWSYNSSEAAAVNENGAQAIYKVSGQWPAVDYNFAYSMTIDPTVKAFYYDYMSETDSKNNIMLFFKNSNATSYVSGEYVSIQTYFEGANISANSGDVKGDGVRRIGKIDFSKMNIPATCYNDDGTLTINAIRVLASGAENKKLYLYDMGYTSEMNEGDYALPQALPLMDPDTITVGDNALKGNYVYDNGRLTVEAMTDHGFRVEFTPDTSFDVTLFKNWLIKATATTPFDVQLEVTTAAANANYGLVSEFAPAFGGAVNGFLPAGTYEKSFELLGCYMWNNVLPANGITTVKKITVILGGKGTLTLDTLQMANSATAGVFADGVYKQGGSSKVFETTYTVQNDMVTGVEVNTTASAFLGTVSSDFTVTIKENGTTVSGNALVKTGQTVVVTADNTILASYTLIVKGDVDRNGQSTTADARLLLGYALGVDTDLTDAQKAAGDLNADGGISTTDARVILQGIVN